MDRTELENDCLILVPDGVPIDRRLTAELDDRGWNPLPRTSPAEVMAELALRIEAARTRAVFQNDQNQDQDRDDAPVLLVLHADRWPWHRQLVTALNHYLPEVAIYASADGLRFTRDTESAAATPIERPSSRQVHAALDDQDDQDDQDVRDAHDDGDDEPQERLSLSQEEIAMLLDAPGDRG